MKTPFWAVGFSNRPRARLAVRVGAIACFVAAGRQELGIIVTLVGAAKPLGHTLAYLVGASIIPLIIAIAGAELLRRRGKLSGSLAALILIADFALIGPQPISAELMVSIATKIVLLLLIANGVRGVFALQKIDFEQDSRAAFD